MCELMSTSDDPAPRLPHALTCAGVRARLGDLLDGELGGTEAQLVRFHVSLCPSCQREREQLRRTLNLLRTLRRQPR